MKVLFNNFFTSLKLLHSTVQIKMLLFNVLHYSKKKKEI